MIEANENETKSCASATTVVGDSSFSYQAYNIRSEALQAALRLNQHGSTRNVIESAEAFYLFLSGVKSTDEVNRVRAERQLEADATREREERGERMAEHNAALEAQREWLEDQTELSVRLVEVEKRVAALESMTPD